MTGVPLSTRGVLRVLSAWVATLRRIGSAAKRLPERLLHPVRRRRARRAVASLHPVRRVTVLCLGNINRSAYAAAALRSRLDRSVGGRLDIASAGFIGPDRPSPPEAVAAAAARGIDLREHRSRLVTQTMVRGADLVVVMNRAQARAVVRDLGFEDPKRIVVLGDLDPRPIQPREIRDPFGQGNAVLEGSFDRIDRCVAELLVVLP